MKVILTGATGMVGEGVLLECLAHPQVEAVLSVGRRPYGQVHPKLKECVVPDFMDLDARARSAHRLRRLLLLRGHQLQRDE